MSADKKIFVQHYTTEGDYHKGQNQVVNPALMKEKWLREVNYLTQMRNKYPDLIPKILKIDLDNCKLFLEVDGPDFWQRSLDANCSFDEILPDWQDQMINIIQAHRSMGWYKYSMHPSSYFIVGGKLKSINYFFTYRKDEANISIADVESHIYSTRQDEMRKHLDSLGIEWNKPQPFDVLEQLCWESFRTNYPADFIERVKCLK
jgi:hypothetical protein